MPPSIPPQPPRRTPGNVPPRPPAMSARPAAGQPRPAPAQPLPNSKERAIPKIAPKPSRQAPGGQREQGEAATPVSYQIPKSTGSKVGIAIASVMVATIVITLVVILMFPQPSDPDFFQKYPELLERAKLPDATTILPSLPTGSGNAAIDYKAAADINKSEKKRVLDAIKSVHPRFEDIPESALTTLKEMHAKVAAGAQKKEMTYFFDVTPKEIKLEREYQPALDLVDLHATLRFLALHYFAKQDYKQAEKVLQDLFTMGWHMFNEDTIVQIPYCGLSVLKGSLIGEMMSLKILYNNQKNSEKALAADSFGMAAEMTLGRYTRKLDAIWKVRPPAGDVFAIITRDQSRAWKVHGILMLGMVKFTGERGDIKEAENLIGQFSSSQDPLESSAAKASAQMTKGDLQGMK